MPNDEAEGLDAKQVRDALDKRGSVTGAANELGVSRQAVYWHMSQNDIRNPYTGNIPGKSGWGGGQQNKGGEN